MARTPYKSPVCRKSWRLILACSFYFLGSQSLPNFFCIYQTPAQIIKCLHELKILTSSCFSWSSAMRSCKAFSASETSAFSSSGAALAVSSSFLLEKKLRWASKKTARGASLTSPCLEWRVTKCGTYLKQQDRTVWNVPWGEAHKRRWSRLALSWPEVEESVGSRSSNSEHVGEWH